MSRPTRAQMFIRIAHVVAERSTCARLNVGAVITLDNRIVSMGWNGQPPGEDHCTGHLCQAFGSPGKCNTIHAEDNAIRRLIDGPGQLAMYVTDSPCPACAEKIINAGITSLYYSRDYRDTSPLELLVHSDVPVFKVMPAGYIMDWRTKAILP